MPFLADIPITTIAFVVIALVVFYASQRSKAADEAWQTAAQRLGLSYTKDGRKRLLEGKYHGFPVRVNTFTRGSGKSSATFTCFQVGYPDLAMGLKLSHQRFFSTLNRVLSGGKDIVIGDKHFDDTVVVEANYASEAIAFLTPERQQLAIDLVTSRKLAQIRDTDASFAIQGVTGKADEIRLCLEYLTEFGASFSGQGPAAQAQVPPTPQVHSPKPAGATIAMLRLDHDTAEPEPVLRPLEPNADPVQAPETPPVESDVEALPELAESPSFTTPVDNTLRMQRAQSLPVDFQKLRADLFETSRMSFEVKEHFEAVYAGRAPTWRGKLERLSDYNSDATFKGGPGSKAIVVLEPIPDGTLTKDVRAIVQLTHEQAKVAKALVGGEVTLTGQLVSCDGFMRSLFLASGTIAS